MIRSALLSILLLLPSVVSAQWAVAVTVEDRPAPSGEPSSRPFITVNGSSNSITVPPGASVTITAGSFTAYAADWVGLFSTSNVSTGSEISWNYMNGTHVLPPYGLNDGQFNMTMPMTAGTYVFRFLQNNGYTLIKQSAVVTVSAETSLVPLKTFYRYPYATREAAMDAAKEFGTTGVWGSQTELVDPTSKVSFYPAYRVMSLTVVQSAPTR